MSNNIIHGDVLDVLPSLQQKSVNLVVTSPPYARMRQREYGGIPEADYPAWTVAWMDALRPSLAPDASVFVNIQSHTNGGAVHDYVLRTRLALRDAGWHELDELIWVKPDAPPRGSNARPKRVWESVLWYAPSKKPFGDLRAMREPLNPATVARAKRAGARQQSVQKYKRITNVITASVGAIDAGTGHAAPYPRDLVVPLITCFSKPGDLVLDPFVGSGTTALVACELGRRYIGVDSKLEYVQLASERLAEACPPCKRAG